MTPSDQETIRQRPPLLPSAAALVAWLEFRHIVKVMDRLMVNLTDFNAVHFGPSSLRHRKSPINASKAAVSSQARKAKERKAQND